MALNPFPHENFLRTPLSVPADTANVVGVLVIPETLLTKTWCPCLQDQT